MRLGRDLKVGDTVYGRCVTQLVPYQVPARVLHESVAAQHPEGLPAWVANLGPTSKSGPIEMTIFLDDDVP
jgi:hypothetical protein